MLILFIAIGALATCIWLAVCVAFIMSMIGIL